MKTLVHVTHEAVVKVGGIGAVLHGLFTSRSYAREFGRSLLIGPLWGHESPETVLSSTGTVLYSSIHGIDVGGYGAQLRPVEEHLGTRFVYGRRRFTDPLTGVSLDPEVLLVDVRRLRPEPLATFKYNLFRRFGMDSYRWDASWEYEQYVRLGVAGYAALPALEIGRPGDQTCILAHEFMGLPLAYAAIMERNPGFRTFLYAHEVPTLRRIVEGNSGHDTLVYPLLKLALEEGKYADELFPQQVNFFKHPLTRAAVNCDGILCVGEQLIDEFNFLGPEMARAKKHVVFNGLPFLPCDAAQKKRSRELVLAYIENLIGYRPDYIFTHVGRFVLSKAYWRDLKALWHIDKGLQRRGKSAVFILLSTERGGPQPWETVRHLEQSHSWPVAHREGGADLTPGEAGLYQHIQKLNMCARNTRVLFINQFGFEREVLGEAAPKELTWMDMRIASDLELGLSIYEPFGIAQMEPLSFGGICLVSSVCGSAGFALKAADDGKPETVVIADFTALPKKVRTLEEVRSIGITERDEVEERVCREAAAEVVKRLPEDDQERMALLKKGSALAARMSWDVVVDDYLVPALRSAE
ncbi:MAG TPA: hypothetical protein PLJ31_12020 [Armatimonadota bacterium]|nr:hypothetical protein [Armatimonadota bacterium]